MTADLSLLARQSSIAKKHSEIYLDLPLIKSTLEIIQLLKDIEATELRAEIDGQVTFIANYRRGFAHAGEIVAKVTDLDSFESEAERNPGESII